MSEKSEFNNDDLMEKLKIIMKGLKPEYDWLQMKEFIISLLEKNLEEYFIENGIVEKTDIYSTPVINLDEIKNCLNNLRNVPFTIQRISELLINPTRNYTKKKNYLSAFYKLVNL